MNQAGDVANWPQVSDNPAQENEMLRGVSQYVANSADSAPVSMVADQAISASGKITLQESPEGYTYIALGLPYDRAWASLARALERSTFEITDRDRSEGDYYTLFIGPSNAEDEGWFDWLFEADEEHPMAGENFVVSVNSVDDDNVTIRLQPQQGAENFDKRQEQGLLSLIKGNIN